MDKTKTFVVPWHQYSKGARALARGLGIRRLWNDGSNAPAMSGKEVLINWGAGSIAPGLRSAAARVINTVATVKNASDKKKFFEKMAKGTNQPRLPEFTTDVKQALTWVREKKVVVARTVLNGHSGAGIVFLNRDNINEFIDAPLYTVYKKKKDEYRVHIAFGEVVDYQKKALRKTDPTGRPIDLSDVDTRIRSHQNGYVYIRNGFETPQDVVDQALRAYRLSGLDFGAVDVLWNDHEQKAYVLEINTAPGIEETTVDNYVKVFLKELR